MKITTTKKVRGILELPSVGIQMGYDHNKDKPQIRVINNKFCHNNDIRVASDQGFIKVTDLPGQKSSKEKAFLDIDVSKTIKLINNTDNPVMIVIDEDSNQKEVAAHQSVYIPGSLLENTFIQQAIKTKKIKIENEDAQATMSLDLDLEPDNEPEEISDKTTAVVVNPNKDKNMKTKSSLKRVNVKKQKTKDKEDKSTMQIYTPSEMVDANEEEDESNFVDKEQEKERIASHPILGKKKKQPSGVVDTEVVKTPSLEGTTPMVVEAKKTKKRVTKKRTAKKKIAKKVIKSIPEKITEDNTEKEVFNLE